MLRIFSHGSKFTGEAEKGSALLFSVALLFVMSLVLSVCWTAVRIRYKKCRNERHRLELRMEQSVSSQNDGSSWRVEYESD